MDAVTQMERKKVNYEIVLPNSLEKVIIGKKQIMSNIF